VPVINKKLNYGENKMLFFAASGKNWEKVFPIAGNTL